MNNLWVHSELRVRGDGFGHSTRPRTFGMLSAVETERSLFQRFGIPLFLLSSVALIPFILGAVVFNMNGTARVVHRLVDSAIPAIASHFHVTGKEALLSKMSLEDRKGLAGQVSYLASLIGDTKSNENSGEMARTIVRESANQNYDPFFVASVIHAESMFKQNAMSHVGAIGLMQLMPDTAKFMAKRSDKIWLGSWRLNDPAYNLELGISYLKYLEDYYDGNRKHALIAYNWGPANLDDALKNRKHIPSSTIKYARSILTRHDKWVEEFGSRKQGFKYLDPDRILG